MGAPGGWVERLSKVRAPKQHAVLDGFWIPNLGSGVMQMKNPAFLGLALLFAGCRATDVQVRFDLATLVIEGATLVDACSGSQRPGVTIVVAGERITFVGEGVPSALPSGVRVIDATGKWVIPGLIDVHVHDASEAYLRRLLLWGVTSIHLMPNAPPDSPLEMERASRAAGAPTPRLQVTAMFAGAFPDNLVPVYEFRKPRTVEEARRDVRELHANGYRQIKIIQDDTTLWAGEGLRSLLIPEPVVLGLVEEAHAQGMRVYVHATQRDVARSAIGAGLEAFMHGVMDVELAADDWRRMRAAGTVWTPAFNAPLLFGDQRLYAIRVMQDSRFSIIMPSADRPHAFIMTDSERSHWKDLVRADGPIVMPAMMHLVEHTAAYMEVLGANTRSALDAGVAIAVGSDGGPAGVSTHLELELLQEHGLTPLECLAAATRGGALALGWEADVGSIEVGKLADFVVLNADPAADIRNCRSIEFVVKGGTIY